MRGGGSVGLGGGVELLSLVFLGQKLQRRVEYAGARRWRVEDECGCGPVSGVGRGFRECEQLPVAARAGLVAALGEGERGRRAMFRADP